MATAEDIKLLFKEFPREAISWRAQSVTKDGDKAMALAYIDARDVMDRLDEILGSTEWQDRYEFHGPRTICYLSIRVDGEWITKADGAGNSDVEAEKGAISDALKRAAVKWGIGRYLYDLDAPWVPCESGDWNGKKQWKRWKDDPWKFVKGPMAKQTAAVAEKPKRQVGFSADGNRTAHAMKKEDAWAPFERELAEVATIPALKKFEMVWSAKVFEDKWPEGWKALAKEEIDKREEAILNPRTTPDNDQFGDPILPGQNGYVDNIRAG